MPTVTWQDMFIATSTTTDHWYTTYYYKSGYELYLDALLKKGTPENLFNGEQ